MPSDRVYVAGRGAFSAVQVPSKETVLSNLLLYRFMIFNALALAFTATLTASGVVIPLFVQDTSRIALLIVALFVAGWLWTVREVMTVSAALNRAKRFGPTPAVGGEREKDLAKVEWINAVSGWLVALGLLGTVVGFWMALDGIDEASVAQASGAQSAVTSLMKGMQVAINTTLVGAVLGLWNEVNFRILRTGLAIYWGDRLIASERLAGGVGSQRP